jgi:phosphoglycolate phosphatase
MAEVPMFPGIASALRRLHEQGHRLFILTSNKEQNVRLFLAEHALEPYFDGVYHCSIFRKGAGIRKLLRRNDLSAKHCWYIGNEAADIEEAQAVDVKGIAVTWSGQDPVLLSAALPARIISKPGELETLFMETGK